LKESNEQRVITLPDFISIIKLAKRQKIIAIGALSQNEDIRCNIYLLDAIEFQISHTLSYHTMGI